MAALVAQFVSMLLFVSDAWADTPVNCSFEDVRGTWLFHEGKRCGDRFISCSDFKVQNASNVLKITLDFPNVASDDCGYEGTWTMVYNQGFEVAINDRMYFAFLSYKEDRGKHRIISYCDRTNVGTSHDVLGNNWACYVGRKTMPVAPRIEYTISSRAMTDADLPYHADPDMLKMINIQQRSWTTAEYAQFEGQPMSAIVARMGGSNSRIYRYPAPAAYVVQERAMRPLPENWDWRNVSGVNYVGPVVDQGGCGSCYALSSLAMLSSRLRIKTKNRNKMKFSAEDVLSCSRYAQGCNGGYVYLTAGRYAHDYGVVPEKCCRYRKHNCSCHQHNCCRFYVSRYEYIGGYYGACSEIPMRKELYENGPIAVSFEVSLQFMHYWRGVFHETFTPHAGSLFDPFARNSHAVLVVGYGIEKATGERYWIVQNSWGTNWGEDGYFRIRRGTNECNFETIAVKADPIP